MILKNAWYKYDSSWVIGDIHLERNADFTMNCGDGKSYKGIDGASEYMQRKDIGEFRKAVYSILDEHIKNGTETLTHLELAVQYCVRLGMFDNEYPKSQINAYIEEIKAMKEKMKTMEESGISAKDTLNKEYRHYSGILSMIGGDRDNISAEGMEFIERKTYEKLIEEHIVPKYIHSDEKIHASREFYRNLRGAVTGLILLTVFIEIPLTY